MGDDLQKELAVPAAMNQLPGRRAAQGESAEHEWAGVVRQLLLSALTLFSDELNCVELLEPQLRDRNRVNYLANRYHTQVVCTALSVGGATLLVRLVRQKQRDLQVVCAHTPPQRREVCLGRPETAMLERISGCSGVPQSVPKMRRLGADPELLTH